MRSRHNENIARKNARRKVMPGFPVDMKFTTPEQLESYFGGSSIVCLRCGKNYRTLGAHLKSVHGMEPDEYREIYGIPWTYGLSCAETTELHSELAKNHVASGIFEPGKYLSLAQEALRRKRQPVMDEFTRRGLEIMNTGKTGEATEKRKKMPKKGTPEFKEKMRNRPQYLINIEILKTYWIGREQTDEHVFNRTGSHKK